MYRGKKNSVYRSLVLSVVLCFLWGSWHVSPMDKGGLLYISLNFLLDCQALSFNNDLDVCVKLKVIKTLIC